MTQRRTPPPSGRERPGVSAGGHHPAAPRPRDGSTPKPAGAKATVVRRRATAAAHERGAPGRARAAARQAPGAGPRPPLRPRAAGPPATGPAPRRPTNPAPGRRARALGAAPHGRARGFARRQPAPPDALPHRRLPVRAQRLRRPAGAHPGLRRHRGRAGAQLKRGRHQSSPRCAARCSPATARARLERRARGRSSPTRRRCAPSTEAGQRRDPPVGVAGAAQRPGAPARHPGRSWSPSSPAPAGTACSP